MKYDHLFQKERNESKLAQIIRRIETQNWKTGYFILMGSFIIGQIITLSIITPTRITEFYGWELNHTIIFVLLGGVMVGFFSPDSYSQSINRAAITITVYNYVVLIIYEFYPRIAETHPEQARLIQMIIAGVPLIGFAFWLYLLVLSFLGAQLWGYATRKVPRYI